MRRREFITLFGGSAVAWPLAARAQRQAMPVIGYLSARSPEDTAHLVPVFRRGLAENGYVEGQTVTIEYRWALGQPDRLPAMAAELVRKPVDVLVSTGGESAALAAEAPTSTIPIAFIIGGDPVKLGLTASYNRPGGNATGISILTATTLEPKRLGLLHELVPQAATIGVLFNPNFPSFEGQIRDVQEAAHALGVQIHVLRASTDREIDAAFETIAQQRIAALAVGADTFFDTPRDKLMATAERHAHSDRRRNPPHGYLDRSYGRGAPSRPRHRQGGRTGLRAEGVRHLPWSSGPRGAGARVAIEKRPRCSHLAKGAHPAPARAVCDDGVGL